MLGSLMKTKPGFALCVGKCPAAQTSVSQWWTAIVLHKHIPKIEPTNFMWRDPTAIETIGRALPSDNIPHPTIVTSRNSLSFPSITHQDGKKDKWVREEEMGHANYSLTKTWVSTIFMSGAPERLTDRAGRGSTFKEIRQLATWILWSL